MLLQGGRRKEDELTLPATRPDFVKSRSARPLRVTTFGAAASMPWCCVVPALLALGGLASSMAGRVLEQLVPAFLATSVGLLARANYLLWVRGHGTRPVRVASIVLTVLSATVWAYRFGVIG